ncbi:YveK family protein [Kocuria flava]|uniref:YveK family protein n=1 Tax=Kocuria flava TaxID=446860 RepID=UPI000C7DB6E4|nr:Wzz/FepE/Etk N-terminal domain-containing protein [Kocuria flava]
MTFDHFVAAMQRSWLLIVLLAVIGAVSGSIIWANRTPEYQSTTSVMMSTNSSEDPAALAQVASYTSGQMESFLALINKDAVLAPVAARTGDNKSAEDIRSMISTNVPVGSTLIDITVTSVDPDEAAKIANDIPPALQEAIGTIVPPGEDGDPLVRVVEVQAAAPPPASSTPGPKEGAQFGGVVGLVLGVLLAVASYSVRIRTRTTNDTPHGWG